MSTAEEFQGRYAATQSFVEDFFTVVSGGGSVPVQTGLVMTEVMDAYASSDASDQFNFGIEVAAGAGNVSIIVTDVDGELRVCRFEAPDGVATPVFPCSD